MKALTGLFTGLLIVNTGGAPRAGPVRFFGPLPDPVYSQVENVAAEAVKAMVFDERSERVDEKSVAEALIKMRDVVVPPLYLASGVRRLTSYEG